MRGLLFVVLIFISGCGGKKKEFLMGDLESRDSSSYDFDCARENIVTPPGEVDSLFLYARWLQKNNQLKREGGISLEVERLYRIAAEHSHPKANINLQNGSMLGQLKLRGEEHLRLSEELINGGYATGYLFVAYFLQQGSAGLKKDESMALRYFRKAADEGNPEAQYYVANKFLGSQVSHHASIKMLQCAARQGHGKSALELGTGYKIMQQYRHALEMFHLGVAAGDSTSTFALIQGFSGPAPTNKLDYLELAEDPERADRYTKIWKVLSGYSYADPKVPEINEIVPLPPAKLPPWDGKLQWLEERLANVPPEKPSEALIHKLAQEKLLDPATGKPMPGSPAFSEANFPVMVCESDQPCPRTGYWKVMVDSLKETVRHFERDEIMPRYKMTWTEPRIWPLHDKVVQREERVEWGLLG
ncbi:DUF6396 domain-containing protein [Pseudomonas sp. NPDC008258]|uniref:SEL1-like repeat protein n=1 Tax=Pseudomonas sp. NPDC008258 TaxID=3364418 RepID=UPI0036E5D242